MCCASSCCAIHKSDCARTVAQTVNADVAALPVLKKLAAMACAASGRLMLLLVASLMLCGRGIVCPSNVAVRAQRAGGDCGGDLAVGGFGATDSSSVVVVLTLPSQLRRLEA